MKVLDRIGAIKNALAAFIKGEKLKKSDVDPLSTAVKDAGGGESLKMLSEMCLGQIEALQKSVTDGADIPESSPALASMLALAGAIVKMATAELKKGSLSEGLRAVADAATRLAAKADSIGDSAPDEATITEVKALASQLENIISSGTSTTAATGERMTMADMKGALDNLKTENAAMKERLDKLFAQPSSPPGTDGAPKKKEDGVDWSRDLTQLPKA